MKKTYPLIILTLVIAAAGFYWYELRPYLGKKECYRRAEMWRQYAITGDNSIVEHGTITKRADYDKVFSDAYTTCLMQKGI